MSDSTRPRRVAVPLVDRANYGRMRPVLQEIHRRPDLELQVMGAGSMVLERFGLPIAEVEHDGLPVASRIHLEVEGSIPTTMAKSVGFGAIEFASELQRLRPDIVLVVGDRYEMFSAVIAAAFMNLCIAHIQGGEVSGSIDESVRHAITKFAHYHFPSTRRAAEYVIQMGESPDRVFMVGCPSSDISLEDRPPVTSEQINATGAGAEIDADAPFLLVLFHPVTTTFGAEGQEVNQILRALDEIRMPTLWLWPNIDAGSDHVSKALRVFRETRHPDWLRLAKNYPPTTYASILAQAGCAVGNSSSFVRDSGFYGTPVVLVGGRQEGREYSHNLVPVAPDSGAIRDQIRAQLAHGRYPRSDLYGDGTASVQIADALGKLELFTQKHLDYIYR